MKSFKINGSHSVDRFLYSFFIGQKKKSDYDFKQCQFVFGMLCRLNGADFSVYVFCQAKGGL